MIHKRGLFCRQGTQPGAVTLSRRGQYWLGLWWVPGRWRGTDGAQELSRWTWKVLVMWGWGERWLSRVTAVGEAGGGGKYGPGEGAWETLWDVEKLWSRLGICFAVQVEGFGASSGLPPGLKILSTAELFSHCLSVVTALARPWQVLESHPTLLAAWEAGDRGALSLQGESPPLN